MCDLQRGLFCRTFSTGAGDAGSADRRSTGAGRCSSGSDAGRKIKESSVILVGLRTASSAGKVVPGDKLKLEARIIQSEGTTGNRRSCCISGWRSCSKGRVVSDDREGVKQMIKKVIDRKPWRDRSSDHPCLPGNGDRDGCSLFRSRQRSIAYTACR